MSASRNSYRPISSPIGAPYLSSLLAERETWDVSACHGDVDLRELMYLYCVDVDTGCRWLGEASYSSFCDVRREVVEGGATHAHAEKLHALIIRLSLNRKLPPLASGLTPDSSIAEEISLIGELACVIVSNPWASDVDSVHPGCHLVAIRIRENDLPLFLSFAVAVSADWGVGPLSDAALVDACQRFLASR